jgi:hypothetical protein
VRVHVRVRVCACMCVECACVCVRLCVWGEEGWSTSPCIASHTQARRQIDRHPAHAAHSHTDLCLCTPLVSSAPPRTTQPGAGWAARGRALRATHGRARTCRHAWEGNTGVVWCMVG